MFSILHTCKEGIAYTTDNYWTPIEVFLDFDSDQSVTLEYEFTCDASYRAIHYDWSLLILLVLSTIVVAILARFGRIVSIKILIR